ncbi:uncharacterized protein BYT42DRAFT_551724 [Radiomyces spectabilis]|uniref:uncharacterized protein n=1 Tax=Radiomyces spectabilis TaxID=64574 RepID=UPI00221F4ECD|nr:uncharacterized protein BYT42DRAFT_551724 [Radiomyces spectabilis]KAI8393636.1 hypothetical protein BYT42DRAFT_551724 [Radiomyces spectabilis]
MSRLMSCSSSVNTRKRTFSPVILFHDHQFVRDESGDLEHVHIPYNDPHYEPFIESHRRRINQMLEHNGRFWSDIILWSREHPTTDHPSPVPSLASSPSPIMLPSPPKSSSTPPPAALTTRRRSRLRLSKPSLSADPMVHRVPSPPAAVDDVKPAGVKRRRGNLPKAVTAVLREWLSQHKKHPYPSEEEKANLARQTNLTLNQISNWFINARRRILQPMLELEAERKSELDILPYDAHHSDDGMDRRSKKRAALDGFSPARRSTARRK